MNFLSSIESSGFSAWVRTVGLGYPLVIFLHAAGLSMVVRLSCVIDFAILGFAPGLPLAPMTKLYRLIGIGFWMNVTSGIVRTMADATTMLINPIFWIKMVLIGLAIADVLIIVYLQDCFYPCGRHQRPHFLPWSLSAGRSPCGRR